MRRSSGDATVKSIRKGKDFEREVANLLSELTGAKWQRVPQSGATATVQGVQNNIFKGDVFCEEERYKTLVVECKITGEVLTLASLLSEKGPLWEWWEQTIHEAGQNPYVLFFRYRRGPIMMLSRGCPAVDYELPVEGATKLYDLDGNLCWLSVVR